MRKLCACNKVKVSNPVVTAFTSQWSLKKKKIPWEHIVLFLASLDICIHMHGRSVEGGAELKCYPSVGTTVHAQVLACLCVRRVFECLMCLSVHSVKGREGGKREGRRREV